MSYFPSQQDLRMSGSNELSKGDETLKSQLEVLWNMRMSTGSTKVPQAFHNGSWVGTTIEKWCANGHLCSEAHLWLAPFLNISLSPVHVFKKED